ncbi:MAG: immunoglobulin domain-containing protein [Caldilineaceae bacterium]
MKTLYLLAVPVIFDSAASGAPVPIAQWQQSIDASGPFSDIPGATLPRLEFVANRSYNAFHYRVIFSNSAGTATSDVATLTVNTWPTISLQPSSQTVNEGQSVTFNAAASGSPTPGIQWQVKANGTVDWQAIGNATSPSLTFVAALAQNGNQYRALFSTLCGSVATNVATLVVNALPPLDTTPPDTTLTEFPVSPSYSSSATFRFSSNEINSIFACSLDSSPFTGCTSPQNYTGLSNGNHTFQVRAVDAAGNIDPSPASYTWMINTKPPVPGPRGTIQSVRAILAALLSPGGTVAESAELSTATEIPIEAADVQGSIGTTNKHIQAAINQLDQSLASKLWVDDNHLTAYGAKVFERLSAALTELLAIKKPPTAVTSAINTLVGVTRTLAQTALDEAVYAHGKPNKISNAQQEMLKAQKKLDKQQFTYAIVCYKNAWVFAQEAVGKGIRAANDENSEEESESTRSQIFLPLLTR